jgi:hypothetical protein
MSLTSAWLQTPADGLVRADQVLGIDVHQTPALTETAPHWLLDVVLPASIGSGVRGEWSLTVLHRTLAQTSKEPDDAATVLARLLAQLDAISAAGIIIASRARDAAAWSNRADDPTADRAKSESEQVAARSTSVRFRFLPFPSPPPGHHTGAEYLWGRLRGSQSKGSEARSRTHGG